MTHHLVDVHQRGHRAAVGPLDNDFNVPLRLAGTQNPGHRSVGVGQDASVRPQQPVSATEALLRIANLRLAAPKFRGALIELDDQATEIADINCDGHALVDLVPASRRSTEIS